jgi:alpha-tubulin suppressor-like RCC1 family protein
VTPTRRICGDKPSFTSLYGRRFAHFAAHTAEESSRFALSFLVIPLFSETKKGQVMHKERRHSFYATKRSQASILKSGLRTLAIAVWCATVPCGGLLAQAPVITRQPQSLNVAPGMKAIFSVQASGSTLRYQWQFDGSDVSNATNQTYTITNVTPADAGSYQVIVTNLSGNVPSAPASLLLGPILAWGSTNTGPGTPPQLLLPLALTNAVAIAAGDNHGLGLSPDGTVSSWGLNTSGATNVPAGLTNVVAVSARRNSSGALRADGTVVVWGNNLFQQTNVPPSLTNAIALGVGGDFCAALRSDGTVLAWGNNGNSQVSAATNLSGVVAISLGGSHGLALLDNSRVAAWGRNAEKQCNVPAGLSGVVAVAAGDVCSLALRYDGTVVAWGGNTFGQTNVPPGLTNVVAIAAGTSHCLALTGDGGIVGWGLSNSGQLAVPPAATNVISLAGGSIFSLALEGNGAPLSTARTVQQGILQGDTLNLTAMTVGAPPLNYQWRFNGVDIIGATNATLSLSDVQPDNAGAYSVVVTNDLGSITNQVASVTVRELQTIAAWGLNGDGQVNVPAGISDVKAVSAGGGHVLALQGDGNVVAWGSNSYGQTNVPPAATNVISIAAGGLHSVALRNDGTVVVWGGSSFSVSHPAFPPTGVKAIAAGREYSLALLSNGTVTAWGNLFQSTGPVGPPPSGLSGVTAVAAGDTHAVALKNDGTVVVWGSNFAGQTNVPAGLSNVIAIAAGYEHTLALKNDGTVVAWGWNASGQTSVPVDLTNAVAVVANVNRSMALRSDGTLVFWGQESFNSSTVPVGLTNVTQISAGSFFNVALVGDSAPCISLPPRGRTILPGASLELTSTTSGTPPLSYQWQRDGSDIPDATNSSISINSAGTGDAAGYQLVVTNRHGSITSEVATVTLGPIIAWGKNTAEQTWIPSGVTNPMQVAGGDAFSVALLSDGSVVDWGDLISLSVPGNITRCTAIAAGAYHIVALLEGGSVAAWGENLYGETNVPAGLSNAIAVAAGDFHSLALTTDGTVVAWGNTNSTRPDQMAGLSNVIVIAAGSQHSLALKDDGTVVAWGQNSSGQTNVPAGLSDVVAIAGGWDYSLALKNDGTVVAWGGSGRAQPPTGLSNVVAIAAGFGGCLALPSDGSVAAWGDNTYGQGNIPSTLNNIVGIAAGSFHNLAIVGDGKPVVVSSVPKRTIRVGGTLRLAALAVGVQPLRYRWQLDGVDIAGATNATLALTGLPSSPSANYRCIISNDLGSVDGPITVVTVSGEPLRFETTPDALNFTNGIAHLRLAGLIGAGPVTVYVSTNLSDWETVFSHAPTTGSLDFDDTAATNSTRFYKAVEGP